MQIKNYTSSINVEQMISRIEIKLAAAGASGIMKLYGPDKQVSAIVFSIDIPGPVTGTSRSVSVKLPANVEACYQAMWKEHVKHHSRWRESTKDTIRDQARRTAWKLVQEWIDIQISMIVMNQAEFLQVFLPYVWDGQQTVFEQIKGGGFKALPMKT